MIGSWSIVPDYHLKKLDYNSVLDQEHTVIGAPLMVTKSVSDEDYRNLVSSLCSLENGPWAAGGSVRKIWYSNQWTSQDIDFFFSSQDQFLNFCENIKLTRQLSENPYETSNAVTFTVEVRTGLTVNIQAIRKRWYSGFIELLQDFDFNLSQFVTDGQIMLATADAIIDCKDNTIRTNKASQKKVTPLRLLKYAAYGFDPEKELLIKSIRSMLSGELGDGY